jgi:hypothetical protein
MTNHIDWFPWRIWRVATQDWRLPSDYCLFVYFLYVYSLFYIKVFFLMRLSSAMEVNVSDYNVIANHAKQMYSW